MSYSQPYYGYQSGYNMPGSKSKPLMTQRSSQASVAYPSIPSAHAAAVGGGRGRPVSAPDSGYEQYGGDSYGSGGGYPVKSRGYSDQSAYDNYVGEGEQPDSFGNGYASGGGVPPVGRGWSVPSGRGGAAGGAFPRGGATRGAFPGGRGGVNVGAAGDFWGKPQDAYTDEAGDDFTGDEMAPMGRGNLGFRGGMTGRGRGGFGANAGREGGRGLLDGQNSQYRGRGGAMGGPNRGRGAQMAGPTRGMGAGGFQANPGRGLGGRGRGPGMAGRGGLSSVGDLVNRAKEKVQMNALAHVVRDWQAFLSTRPYDGPVIRTMESALHATRVPDALLEYDSQFLCRVNYYTLFTGVLYLTKYAQGTVVQSIFLARGMDTTVEGAEEDTYRKAYELLMSADVSDILYQEDIGHHSLITEVETLYAEDPRAFLALLHRSNFLDEGPGPGPHPGRKRPNPMGGPPDMKKRRMQPLMSEMPYRDPHSLLPKKKVGILMNAADPLKAKLEKLKELLKEEGITKLHIVPKIDQLSHKTAINIKNVYRYVEVPYLGYECKTEVFVEVYFDNVFIAAGQPHHKRNVAMQLAYKGVVDTLCSEPLGLIAAGSRYWHDYMASEPDICHVALKWEGDDNNSLLTSNLANMKQMMQSMPDFSIPVNNLILTEHESDASAENVFKCLELSATRNLMLLEVELVRNINAESTNFTCMMSLNGKHLASRSHNTKNGAKRVCSEAVMKELNKTSDRIYVHKDHVGKTVTKTELIDKAQTLRENGHPPAYYETPPPPSGPPPKEKPKTAQEKAKQEKDRQEQERIENLPENVDLKPLMPWVAAAFYQILDEYYEKVTMEDITIDIRDMCRSQFEVLTYAASRMGLRVITKLRSDKEKTKPTTSLLRRTFKAQEMLKILQINDSKSGRYVLNRLVHASTPEELEQYKAAHLEKYSAMKAKREGPAETDKQED